MDHFKLSPEAEAGLPEAARHTDAADSFKLSPETQAALQETVRQMVKAADEFIEALARIIEEILERVRQVAEELGRFFLKRQLLERRLPYPVADFVSKRIFWYWGWVIGVRWFNGKLSALE
jgi:hypothetical protein